MSAGAVRLNRAGNYRPRLIIYGIGLIAALLNSPSLCQTVYLIDPVPVGQYCDSSLGCQPTCDRSHPYLMGQFCLRAEQQNLAQRSSVEALEGDVTKLKSDSSVSQQKVQQNIKSLTDVIDALTARLNQSERRAN
jgi:hypothetical protein